MDPRTLVNSARALDALERRYPGAQFRHTRMGWMVDCDVEGWSYFFGRGEPITGHFTKLEEQQHGRT